VTYQHVIDMNAHHRSFTRAIFLTSIVAARCAHQRAAAYAHQTASVCAPLIAPLVAPSRLCGAAARVRALACAHHRAAAHNKAFSGAARQRGGIDNGGNDISSDSGESSTWRML